MGADVFDVARSGIKRETHATPHKHLQGARLQTILDLFKLAVFKTWSVCWLIIESVGSGWLKHYASMIYMRWEGLHVQEWYPYGARHHAGYLLMVGDADDIVDEERMEGALRWEVAGFGSLLDSLESGGSSSSESGSSKGWSEIWWERRRRRIRKRMRTRSMRHIRRVSGEQVETGGSLHWSCFIVLCFSSPDNNKQPHPGNTQLNPANPE
jgi:hypothetical protein